MFGRRAGSAPGGRSGGIVMTKSWLRWLCAVLVLAMVATACGSDREDDPSADDDTTETTEGSDTTEAGDDEEAATFGDLESPCGEGDGGPATEQGVTEDTITIGYGDDAGFPTSPGLSQETSHAIEAFIEWCNEQGGINGRQIEGKYYDAKITEVVNAVTQACSDVFMLVGQAWAFDGGQEETRIGCDLATVPTYSVSAEFANAPLMHQPVPNPVDRVPIAWAHQLAELFPDKITKASVMYADFGSIAVTKDKALEAFPEAGFEFLPCLQAYPIGGTADWRPFAQALKDCGAEIVYYIGQAFPNMQNLLDAAAQLDYRPIWITDANNYLESFAAWNTAGNGDDVYVRTAFTPFEQMESNPATQQYVETVEANGGKISQLGEQTTSAFFLWATAAKECGADLTRQCVLDELSKIDSWTGGGLHAESNPAENLPPECGMLLSLDGTEWVQEAPEEEGEFDCSPDYVAEVTGPFVDAVQLGPDRVSQLFQM